MLARAYLFGGVFLITSYTAAEWFGWEFGNPIRVRPVPPIGAAVVRGSGGWGGGRSSTYRYYSYSSGTRSGVGGGGLGGK
jgi:hypothetical protein